MKIMLKIYILIFINRLELYHSYFLMQFKVKRLISVLAIYVFAQKNNTIFNMQSIFKKIAGGISSFDPY